MTTYKKKLIEVALPLEEINKESAREKSIRHGHPSTLHLWWARRPLAACRAVLFSQLVDDPDQEGLNPDYLKLIDKLSIGKYEGQAKTEAEKRRFKLFAFIEELVKWENIKNEKLFNQAFELINASCDGNPPPVYDPFCGGGSIPLEAQRLGLEAYGSDLNPVAVMISKALVEIPPKFAGQPPINPESQQEMKDNPKLIKKEWKGAEGLAEDVKYYGKWMREEAFKHIGHLYPQVELEDGTKANVIAWLWARTVKSPDPRFHNSYVPLISTFWLSKKPGKFTWLEPEICLEKKQIKFNIKVSATLPENTEEINFGTKTGRGANFKCLLSGSSITDKYIKEQSQDLQMKEMLTTIVCEGNKTRIYLPANEEHTNLALNALPLWKPEQEMNKKTTNLVSGRGYRFDNWSDLFTNRQLTALTTFSSLIEEVRKNILNTNGNKDYANAVAVYLVFNINRCADFWSNMCIWSPSPKNELVCHLFAKQAISMTYDYGEVNPFSKSGGSWDKCITFILKNLEFIPNNPVLGKCFLKNAINQNKSDNNYVLSTDPPYYDNISYADLSDFFYIWMRSALKDFYPDIFSTLLTPKDQELIVAPYRFKGGKKESSEFFSKGMEEAFINLANNTINDFPSTIYYAFKQSENENKTEGKTSISSTGWEVFLESLINAGYMINGTWPMRTERPTGIKEKINALASSIILVCRKQPKDLPVTTRGDFIKALKRELPKALKELKHGNIAPVDMAQSSIGPGMAIFTKYSKVMEADGSAMTVKTALQIINESLDEYLAEQEGDYDTDTRFAITWFEQHGMKDGDYGTAETLANARNVSVQGVVDAGVLTAKSGKVKLIPRDEMPADWDPTKDDRLTVWEATQHLIRIYQTQGETPAAELMNKLGPVAESAKDLAYRLYAICERKKWADEALAYNGLVIAWPNLVERASQIKKPVKSKEKSETVQQKLEV